MEIDKILTQTQQLQQDPERSEVKLPDLAEEIGDQELEQVSGGPQGRIIWIHSS